MAAALAPETYRAMGLTDFEFERIRQLLGREPNLVETGMFAAMWSEHCGYKHSRPVLAYFKKYREALEGKGFENAGLIDLGDGLAVAMKIESHNHPSTVEPYQGAATGVGGIIRDILAMGARPIACLNSLRFGPIREGEAPPEVVTRNRYLFHRVVAGIADYGNCVGVPTVAGEVAFHPRYSGNPLVNAMCVGIVRTDRVATAEAKGVGNAVIYAGSATGRDGIHGATFASETLGEDSDSKRPNVQIGDPFAEKLLIEATLDALESGAVVAIQDMGAAGLTCSTSEMAAKGGVGMDVDLDRVPTREPGTTAYEMMLSESQERMMAVATPGREEEVLAAFRRWGLKAEIVGQVTSEPVLRIRHSGRVEAELDPTLLTDHCPTYTMPGEEPEYHRRARAFDVAAVTPADLHEALLQLLAHPTHTSKRFVYEQYDHQVQTQTALLPGVGDAAVIAPRGTKKGLAVKVDGNARQVYLDPYVGAQLVVAEAARNVACVGGLPSGVTDGLNFGNPQHPHVYWQFERAVKGLADACEVMETPVVSGNVSFYNESELGEVLPTPLIGMLGILPEAERRIGMGLSEGLTLLLIETPLSEIPQQGLGGSAYLADVLGLEDGLPVPPDLDAEKRLCRWLVDRIHARELACAHDLSEGGLVFALAEMAIVGQTGAQIALPPSPHMRLDARLYGEVPGRVIVGCRSGVVQHVRATAEAAGLSVTPLGETGGSRLVVADNQSIIAGWTLGDMKVAYEASLS